MIGGEMTAHLLHDLMTEEVVVLIGGNNLNFLFDIYISSGLVRLDQSNARLLFIYIITQLIDYSITNVHNLLKGSII